MSKRYGTVEERFWREVIPEPMSGCWLWTGPVDENGYARFRIGRTKVRMHRWSYEREKGTVPVGLVVRHKCDLPCCVNPEHLELGTHADNIRDMDNRARRSRGEHHLAKLTEDDIRAIRSDRRTKRAIAADYGVAHSIICRIQRREDWRHVL